jgi:hypothetical protein
MQVTRVSLQLEASLSGLRHVMYRHPWVSAVLGVGTNMLILLTIIAVSWTRFRMQGSVSTVVERLENDEVEEDEDNEDNEDNAPTEDHEGLEGPEDVEVPDEAAGSVAKQTLSNWFKWFVIKLIFKVSFRTKRRYNPFLQALWYVVRVALFVGVAMVCYELTILGPNTPRYVLLSSLVLHLMLP